MPEPTNREVARPAHPRQPPTGFVQIAGMLLAIVGGGALAGAALALVTAPGSSVALAVCAFTLPLATGWAYRRGAACWGRG